MPTQDTQPRVRDRLASFFRNATGRVRTEFREEMADMRNTFNNSIPGRRGGSWGQFWDAATELVPGMGGIDFYNSDTRTMRPVREMLIPSWMRGDGEEAAPEPGQPGRIPQPATRASSPQPGQQSAVPHWLNPASAGPRPNVNQYANFSSPDGSPAAPRYFWEPGYGGVNESREGLYGDANGMMRAPDQPVPTARRGANRGNATLVGDRAAAEAWARSVGYSASGLGSRGGGGASSYGRDQLNSQWREA